MSLLRLVHRHLGWKLFLSYLIVILTGAGMLITAAEVLGPHAFRRHLAAMAESVGTVSSPMLAELLHEFRHAITEAISLGSLAAVIVAVGLSLYVSRRVVGRIQEMMRASLRIAAGHYDERVKLYGESSMDEQPDELGQLALSFNQMASTLEHTETLRRELIGNVAHELRTPLTSIKGYMEGLIDGVLPATPETFYKVYHEADRLQRLVYDLQELSRVEAGAFQLKLHPISVATLVHATIDRLQPQFEEKDVTLKVELPPNLPSIRGDDDRLGQVLLNLVGNALQYTPTGGMVTLRARREGRFVRIEVVDTGVGLSAEHIPHIFDRFYRVDNSRFRVGGGSGIGLTIAKHLVEAHGGEISASSKGLNQGSIFAFTVPVA